MSSRAVLKIALVLALLPVSAPAEDAVGRPERPGWKWWTWRFPVELSKLRGEDEWKDKFKPIEGSDTLFDIVEWMPRIDVVVPKGGVAVYAKASQTLTMFAPIEVLGHVDAYIEWSQQWGSRIPEKPSYRAAPIVPDEGERKIMTEVSLVEYELRSDQMPAGWSYDDLRKAAGATWCVWERASFRGAVFEREVILQAALKLGSRRADLKPEMSEDERLPKLAAGDEGLLVVMEPFLNKDGVTFDLALGIEHRGPLGGNGPKLNQRVSTEVGLLSNQPMVVAQWGVPEGVSAGGGQRHVALIVCVRRVHPGGWPRLPGKP